MTLSRRFALSYLVVFLLSTITSAAVFTLAAHSRTALTEYREQTRPLELAVWGLRSGFYNYDDQMNMYVAVLAGSRSPAAATLAETTYQEAVGAAEDMRSALAMAMDLSVHLPADQRGEVAAQLGRVEDDLAAYDEFARQTRQAALDGDVAGAVYLSTQANLEPSNDIMPALDEATSGIDAAVTAQLRSLADRQLRLEQLSVASALMIALLIAGLATEMVRRIVRRLSALQSAMTEIAADPAQRGRRLGDGSARNGSSKDEIARLAQAFDRLLDTLAEQDADLASAAEDRQAQLAAAFEQQRDAERQVRTRAQDVIDDTATSVCQDLQRLGGQVETVRDAARTIEDRVETTDAVTRQVVQESEEANRLVGQLQGSLDEVGHMASLIAAVADQTKLLALNATIEAARAGDAGLGFGVVASEVKDLATTTARSSGKITATISALQQNSDAVADALGRMERGITGIDDATSVLRDVAAAQFAVVASLDEQMNATIDRIGAMSTLTEKLERRAQPRKATTGSVEVRANARSTTFDLVDISTSGLGCISRDGTTLPGGTAVDVVVAIGGARLHLRGTVVPHPSGSRSAGHRMGIAFTDVPAAEAQALAALLEPQRG